MEKQDHTGTTENFTMKTKTYNDIVIFYATCRAPTEREILQKELGMGNFEFFMYLEFMEGKNDNWLITSI